MGKLSALIGIVALAGAGFYIGKKLIEKKNAEEERKAEHIYDDEPEVFVEEKHSTPKEKLQKASLFAVGAIKTGTEKLKEGIDTIINSEKGDMVAKGEETLAQTKEAAAEKKEKALEFAKTAKEKTVEFAKGAGDTIKTEIDNIKNKLSSINVTPAEEEPADDSLVEEVAAEADEIADVAKSIADDIGDVAKDTAEEVGESIENALDKLEDAGSDFTVTQSEESHTEQKDDLDRFDFDNTASIETFDFSDGSDDTKSGSGSETL